MRLFYFVGMFLNKLNNHSHGAEVKGMAIDYLSASALSVWCDCPNASLTRHVLVMNVHPLFSAASRITSSIGEKAPLTYSGMDSNKQGVLSSGKNGTNREWIIGGYSVGKWERGPSGYPAATKACNVFLRISTSQRLRCWLSDTVHDDPVRGLRLVFFQTAGHELTRPNTFERVGK